MSSGKPEPSKTYSSDPTRCGSCVNSLPVTLKTGRNRTLRPPNTTRFSILSQQVNPGRVGIVRYFSVLGVLAVKCTGPILPWDDPATGQPELSIIPAQNSKIYHNKIHLDLFGRGLGFHNHGSEPGNRFLGAIWFWCP